MKNIVLVYDDTVVPSERVRTIIGDRSFGQMILKRKSMYRRVSEMVAESKDDIAVSRIGNYGGFEMMRACAPDTVFCHILSSSAVVNQDDFEIMLEKLKYVNERVLIRNDGKTLGAIFKDRADYFEFLKEYKLQKDLDFLTGSEIEGNFLTDLTDYTALLMYISGGFDARFFNSLQGDNYTVTKRSGDKKKMKMEYTYYWLLPEHMKSFMVMPYDFKENKGSAQYTMERMPMTDIAIRWTHGAVDMDEFKHIMQRTAYFLTDREKKGVMKADYIKTADALYLKKLDERVKKLKGLKEYRVIGEMIANGTEYNTIDEIVNEYKELYKVAMARVLGDKHNLVSVIGHGDLFFANMLFSKETGLLRLIDPKGALKESELWTDPYYDIAKLSHSICGCYDYFNTGSYDISIDEKMQYKLTIQADTTKYKMVFRDYLEEAGYDYIAVRIFEASLFLSMLPLHIDDPRKVFGFILNAINIIKEVEENV